METLSWFHLAEKTIEKLRDYDTVHGTHFTYYLDTNVLGIQALAHALEYANKALVWRKVEDGNGGK